MTDWVSVAAGDSDAAGEADGDALGSAAIALTYTQPISANKTRVDFINHNRSCESSRNGPSQIIIYGEHDGELRTNHRFT